jgi:hypothetical protein
VDKKILLEHIQSVRPNQIKIEGKMTKYELIKGLFEQQDVYERSSTKDMMELHDESDLIPTITRPENKVKDKAPKNIKAPKTKEKPVKAPEEKSTKEPTKTPIGKPIEKPTDEKPTDEKPTKEEPTKEAPKKDDKPSGKRVQGTGLKFATDLGFKAVALNSELRKLNEPKEIALQSMFTPKELRKIIRTSPNRWAVATPNEFHCRAKNLASAGENYSQIPCWRTSELDKVRMANQIPRGLLLAYYTRLDEGKNVTNPKSGEELVPMGGRSDNIEFRVLPLSDNRNAVGFKLPNSDDFYIAQVSTKKVDFLFNIDKPKATTPTKEEQPESVTKSTETTGEQADQRSSDLLFGLDND